VPLRIRRYPRFSTHATHKEQQQQIGKKKTTSNKANNLMKLEDIKLDESVVPFGGSALAVDNPDRAILGG
jgi:hypothetical protein